MVCLGPLSSHSDINLRDGSSRPPWWERRVPKGVALTLIVVFLVFLGGIFR